MKMIGLIGCGSWGSNIMRDLLALDCSVHVVDIDPIARARASERGALAAFASLDDLPPCDGYVVAVPIPDLTPQCLRLLPRKKPIFSEKTLCLSLDDFNLLDQAGGSAYIFAMHKWHYHPGIEVLRRVASSGKIGKLAELHATRHAWVADFHGGDVFWTQAVHDLTITRHILGYIPPVRFIDVVHDRDGLPVAFTALMGKDPTVVLSISGRHCSRVSGVSLQGSTGSAELHDAYDGHVTVRNEGGIEKVGIDTTFPLYLELKEFVGYLDGGVQPRCNLQAAKEMTQAILDLRTFAGLH